MLFKFKSNKDKNIFFFKIQKKNSYLKIKTFIFIGTILFIICTKIFQVYTNSRIYSLIKGRKFLNICLKGKLINYNKLKFINNPKISIIIPIHNSYKTIKSAIRSIQNQNMIKIEIIVINDFSFDNSFKVIKELMEEDKRIRLINNSKNMGILYSRCIGVLNSKGKYILNLDQDDMFFDNILFNKIYRIAEKGNYDIVSFMEIHGNNYYIKAKDMKDGICNHHPNSLIIHQPQLQIYPFFKNEKYYYNDIHIWGKLFKNDIYKNAISLMGKERYSIYNIMNEDQIALFAICNIAKSYIFIRKYGLFHLKNKLTTIHKIPREHHFKMTIFFSELIFDISKIEYKKYSVLLILFPKYSNLSSFLKIETLKIYLTKVLRKLINSKYIDNKYKEKIRIRYKKYHISYN